MNISKEREKIIRFIENYDYLADGMYYDNRDSKIGTENIKRYVSFPKVVKMLDDITNAIRSGNYEINVK